ncbi:MAG: M23 family metallopeptidase [Tissierellaceae bacterium]|nr:M23 family metallopeptidase [Tissierellaceae bacterium]
MKNKIIKVVKENGFLLFLFICVCIVAIGTISIVTKEVDKDKPTNDLVILDDPVDVEQTGIVEENLNSNLDLKLGESILDKDVIAEENEELEEDFIELEESKEPNDYAEEVFYEGEDEDNDEEIQFIENYVEEPPKANIAPKLPIEGEIITEFAKDKLIYSETLEEWRGHSGIDIKAEVGSKVITVLDGTVTKVYEDSLWGKTIVIDHGEGLQTKYSNLGTLEMVKEGLEVRQGDNIATVGKSAHIELLMDDHLHFEVINKDKSVDPRSIIP